jgi:hypothetical protein
MNRLQLAILSDAIYETICEVELGAPGGHIYAAVLNLVDFNQFNAIMAALVKSGKVVKRGQCYYPADKAPPKGVEVYGLDDPSEFHNAIKKAVE